MKLLPIETELKYLIEVLPDDPAPLVVVDCEPAEIFAPALAKKFGRSTVYVVTGDAKDFGLAERPDAPPNIKLKIAKTLDFMKDELADLTIMRASGFEGKARVRQRIADAAAHLKPSGKFYLLTHKRRGASGHMEMVEQLIGNYKIVFRGGGGLRVIMATGGERPPERPPEVMNLLDEMILGERYQFYTSPAVFSKSRVDLGTRFLLDYLDIGSARRIADVGCGYGVIGIVLARRFPDASLTLSDVDLESVELAKRNIALNGVERNAAAFLSDGFQQLPAGSFDLIISHFPLHISRSEFAQIISDAHKRLTENGRLCGVALSAYDVRPTIQQVFGDVTVVAEREGRAESDGYRVVCAVKRTGSRAR
jgi:16S rRNA (guanine1207-N2)-methyltransferase